MYSYSKIKTSLQLIKSCLALLKGNRRFLLFPAVSLLSTGAVIFTFMFPIIFAGSITNPLVNSLSFQSCFLLFVYYLLNSAITIFFNTAMAAVVYKTMNGERPGFMEGLKEALMHLRSIIVYALLSSIVGILLYKITEKLRILGSIISIIAGTTWNLAAYLVIPSMIIENNDIFTSMKRSIELIKKTWGESLTGSMIMDTGFYSSCLFIFFILIPGATLLVPAQIIFPITLFFLFCLIVLLVISSFISTMESIYSVTLFRYAVEGHVNFYFDELHLKNAFMPNPANKWSRK